MKLKTLINATFIMATLLTPNNAEAQERTGFEETKERILHANTRTDIESLKSRSADIKAQMADRLAEVKPGNLATIFGDEATLWTDGRVLISCITDFSETPHVLHIGPFLNETVPGFEFALPKGSQTAKNVTRLTNRKQQTLQLATAGKWRLLIIRDKQGNIEQVYTTLDNEETAQYIPQEFQLRDLHDVYDGLYRNSKGEEVFFGPNDLYSINTYNCDPGLFYGIPDGHEGYTDLIAYANGRVSRGDPSSPNYGKMPGGGGAAAIMGPMVWALRPSLNGIDAKVIIDEKFVDHMPGIKPQETLQHVASPYGDEVPGQWAFASVRPICRGMLKRFPKALLRLIRNEIYARHGHRFQSAPDVQQFFDLKSWYKPLSSPTPLSAIEQLNVQVIKAEEASRKGESTDLQSVSALGRLLSVEYSFMGMARPYYGDFELKRGDNGQLRLSCSKWGKQVSWPVDEEVLQKADSIIQNSNIPDLQSSYSMKTPDGERILDGFRWNFYARYEKQNFSSSGRNAWPADSDRDGLRAIEKLLNETAQKYDPENK